MSEDLLYYEYPLNERLRSFLRLESLFKQIDHHLQGESEWDHRENLTALLEILGITSRTDLKRELLKELERLSTNLVQIKQNPDVHLEKLDHVLDQLNKGSKMLHSHQGQIGAALKSNDFISSIRQRSSLPGGICVFDLPAYHFWLKQPQEIIDKDFGNWLSEFDILRNTSQLVTSLIRESAVPKTSATDKGFYQQSLESFPNAQLIRIGIPKHASYFPEVSAGKHRFTIRLLEHASNGRPTQVTENTKIELAICAV